MTDKCSERRPYLRAIIQMMNKLNQANEDASRIETLSGDAPGSVDTSALMANILAGAGAVGGYSADGDNTLTSEIVQALKALDWAYEAE